MIRPLAHASRLILQVPAGQQMQIAYCWAAVTNSPGWKMKMLLNANVRLLTYYEEYRETRTQKNNLILRDSTLSKIVLKYLSDFNFS